MSRPGATQRAKAPASAIAVWQDRKNASRCIGVDRTLSNERRSAGPAGPGSAAMPISKTARVAVFPGEESATIPRTREFIGLLAGETAAAPTDPSETLHNGCCATRSIARMLQP